MKYGQHKDEWRSGERVGEGGRGWERERVGGEREWGRERVRERGWNRGERGWGRPSGVRGGKEMGQEHHQ